MKRFSNSMVCELLSAKIEDQNGKKKNYVSVLREDESIKMTCNDVAIFAKIQSFPKMTCLNIEFECQTYKDELYFQVLKLLKV